MSRFFIRPSFAFFWGSHTVSSVGTWMDYVVLNLYVYKLFGSASVLGSFLVVRLLPTLIFAPLGGYLADRFPRRPLLIACDLFRALLILGYVVVSDVASFFVLGVVLASFDRVYQAVQGAYVPDIVRPEELLEANSLMRMSTSATTVLGPAIGAMLVSGIGFGAAFAVDSATFLISALLTCMVKAEFSSGLAPGTGSKDEQLSSAEPSAAPSAEPSAMRLVVAFLLASPVMLYLFVVRLVDSFGGGTYMTGLPVLCLQTVYKDGGVYGWLIGVWALGTLLGSFGAARCWGRDRVPTVYGFALAVVVMSIGMGATFWTGYLPWALAFIFLGGLGDGLSGLLFQTYLMRTAPTQVRGRVIGTSLAILQGASAVGMALTGPMLEYTSVPVLTGIASVVVALSAILGLAGIWAYAKWRSPQGLGLLA